MITSKNPKRSLLCKRTARQILSVAFAMAIFILALITPAYADAEETIQSSTFYIGLTKFLNDLMTVAMILCPIIGGIAAVVFLIRRSMADEQDGKGWTKRIWTAIICGVAGSLVTGVIALITSYVGST